MRFILVASALCVSLALMTIKLSPVAAASPLAPAVQSCACEAHPTYSNDCTCGISVLTLVSTDAVCSAPPECGDLLNDCTATFKFKFNGQCGSAQYELTAKCPCEGSADAYKRCPGATTAIGLHLTCEACN